MQNIISNIDPSKGKSYEKYLSKLIKEGVLDVTDVQACNTARDILTKHMQYKKHLDPKYKNLMAYTLEQLDKALSDIVKNTEETPYIKTEELKVYEYDSGSYTRYKKLYSETKWCTTNEVTYKNYVKNGNLYVIHYSGEYFQWHPASWSLMDSNDKQVDAYLINILLKDFPMEITVESERKLLQQHINREFTMRKPKLELLDRYEVLAYCMFATGEREPSMEDKIAEDYFTIYYYRKYVMGKKDIKLENFHTGYDSDEHHYIPSKFHFMFHYAMEETKVRLEFTKCEQDLCNEAHQCDDLYQAGISLIDYVEKFKPDLPMFREAIKKTHTVYEWIKKIEKQRCYELEPFIRESDLLWYWCKFIPKTERWTPLEQHIMKQKSDDMNEYDSYLIQHRIEAVEETIISANDIGYFYAKQHGLLDKYGDKVNKEIWDWDKVRDTQEANMLSYHIRYSSYAFHCLNKFPDIANKHNVLKLITDNYFQHSYVKLRKQRVPEFEEQRSMSIGYYINALHGGELAYVKAIEQYPFILELEADLREHEAYSHASWIRNSVPNMSYWELRERYPIIKKCESLMFKFSDYEYTTYASSVMKFNWSKAYFLQSGLREKIHVKCLKLNRKEYQNLL